MKTLQTTQLNRDFLFEELKKSFPDYLIKKQFGNIGIRKKKFTITQQVGLMINKKNGNIRTNTALDMVFIYIMFCWPLAVYTWIKKKEIKALEDEVLEEVDRILISQKQNLPHQSAI